MSSAIEGLNAALQGRYRIDAEIARGGEGRAPDRPEFNECQLLLVAWTRLAPPIRPRPAP